MSRAQTPMLQRNDHTLLHPELSKLSIKKMIASLSQVASLRPIPARLLDSVDEAARLATKDVWTPQSLTKAPLGYRNGKHLLAELVKQTGLANRDEYSCAFVLVNVGDRVMTIGLCGLQVLHPNFVCASFEVPNRHNPIIHERETEIARARISRRNNY